MPAVSAPQHHRVVELAAVLIGNAVEFRPGQCRCADNDCFIVKGVLTGLADGLCQVKVMGVKLLQTVSDGNVAEAESALCVVYNFDCKYYIFVFTPSVPYRETAF